MLTASLEEKKAAMIVPPTPPYPTPHISPRIARPPTKAQARERTHTARACAHARLDGGRMCALAFA
jgi:hypothetical protein